MNSNGDLSEIVWSWLFTTVIAGTIYVLWPLRGGAGHNVSFYFALPYHMDGIRQVLFVYLAVFYWFSFSRLWNAWWPAHQLPRRIAAFMLVVLAGYAALRLYDAYVFHGILRIIMRFPLARQGLKCFVRLLSASFPITCLGTWLFISAALVGLGRRDQLADELKERHGWNLSIPDWVHRFFTRRARKKKAVYLGFDITTRRPLYLTSQERNGHIHVLGATGTGKTRYVLLPMIRQDILGGHGVIFIDAKGSLENARMIKAMAREAGREKDVMVLSITQREASQTYNPLELGDASQLKDKVMATIEWSEPYYKGACNHVLQSLFMDLDSRGERATLMDLVRILKDKPGSLPGFCEVAKEHADDIGRLRDHLGTMVKTPFAGLFTERTAAINLLDVYKKGKIAYFALDTQSYPDTAMDLGKMITQDLNVLSGIVETQLSEKEKRTLAVYIDEYQAFGTKGFLNAIIRGRSSGLRITIAHQSLGDLKAIDPAYCQQVVDSTNTKICLRVNDPDTAQNFCDSLGTRAALTMTRQIHLEGESPKNIMGSEHVSQKYHIHPSEVKSLPTGRAVFKGINRHARLILPGYFPNLESLEAGSQAKGGSTPTSSSTPGEP